MSNQVESDVNQCRHCNVEINPQYEFCTYCAHTELALKESQLQALRDAAQAMLNAQIDQWAAGTDHESFAATAVVVATHDALTALLEQSK
jgi:hypothetical protein